MTADGTRPLDGQVALVTGGSSGYGTGIAAALADAGATTWITGRRVDALRAAADAHGLHPITADVTDAADWDRVVNAVMREHGRLDVLVNNAGGGVRIAPIGEQTDDEITRSVEVNLTGHLLGCRRAVPIMRKQASGLIVNVSSVCADYAWGGWSVYSAAKAGMNQFSRCLDAEVRAAGVRVTCVNPSWGATQFTDSADLGPRDAETRERCIQPRELGDLIAYVAAMPSHLIASTLTLWPSVQQFEPL